MAVAPAEPNRAICGCVRSFANPSEEASPRAKANLIRGVVTGKFDPAILATDDMKEIADLCVNCHQCRLECPAGVDIPKLMIEAKAAYVATNGLRPSDWLLARFDLLSAWGSRFSPMANWIVGNRQARWVLEKLLGIAQGRKLPRFASSSFLRLAARRRLTKPTRRSGRKVLYFVDTYANHHDPKLAEALVAVLEHNGVAVYVPPNQYPSGMGMISMGAVRAGPAAGGQKHSAASRGRATGLSDHRYRALDRPLSHARIPQSDRRRRSPAGRLRNGGSLHLSLALASESAIFNSTSSRSTQRWPTTCRVTARHWPAANRRPAR